jgi:hypothetical protein
MKNIKERNKLALALKILFKVFEYFLAGSGLLLIASFIAYRFGIAIYDFNHVNHIFIWPWYGLVTAGYIFIASFVAMILSFFWLKAWANKNG